MTIHLNYNQDDNPVQTRNSRLLIVLAMHRSSGLSIRDNHARLAKENADFMTLAGYKSMINRAIAIEKKGSRVVEKRLEPEHWEK